jgi:hypothetical protein
MIYNKRPGSNVSLTIIGPEEEQTLHRNPISEILGAMDPMEHLHQALKSQVLGMATQREDPEAVDHPTHYRSDSGFEAIDVIEAWDLNFNLGSALKYICRAGLKTSRKEDLQKAIWFLTRELDSADS